MRHRDSKADWIENNCPTCGGTGSLPQTVEEAREAIKRGIVSAPDAPDAMVQDGCQLRIARNHSWSCVHVSSAS